MTKIDVVIYGHIGFDEDIIQSYHTKMVGGAAYYSSIGASLFSTSSKTVSVIGNDFLLAHLSALGIDTEAVHQVEDSSALFQQKYDGEYNISSISIQLNACEKLCPEFVPKAFLNASYFLIAAAPPEQQEKILVWLSENRFSGRIFLDTHIHYMRDFLIFLPKYYTFIDILAMNEQEYEAVGELATKCDILIVKRGSEGVSLWHKQKWFNIPAPKVDKVVTTTGAGDILGGVFLAELSNGNEINSALLKAVEVATESVTAGGVEHLKRKYGESPKAN